MADGLLCRCAAWQEIDFKTFPEETVFKAVRVLRHDVALATRV